MSKAATIVKLNILVFKGDPDLPDYRHTALLVEKSSDENIMCHIVGEAPNFSKDMVPHYQPTKSKRLLQIILVGKITKAAMSDVGAVCYRTPIKSGYGIRWNCQNWIEDALDAICKEKWITNDAKSSAIKEMWEAVQKQQKGDTVQPPTGRHASAVARTVQYSIPELQSASTNRHGGVRNPDPQLGERAEDRHSTFDEAKLRAAGWRQLPPTKLKDLAKSQPKRTTIDGRNARTWAGPNVWIFEDDIH